MFTSENKTEMTESNVMLSDQIEGSTHPKFTKVLYGHDTKEQEFIDCFKSGKLHHSWLITGNKGIGKATLAWRLAKFILTQPVENQQTNSLFDKSEQNESAEEDGRHKKEIYARILAESEPRLFVLRRSFDEKRKTFRSSIRVDEIRRLNSFFSLSVSDGGFRVAIIDCADDMNVNAANALLKTLEEPPKNTVFFLISHNPLSLLSTMKSRSRELRLNSLNTDDLISSLRQLNLSFSETDRAFYTLLGSGSVGNTIRLLEYDGANLYRTVLSFLDQLPNLNGFELEKFISSFSGAKNKDRLELFIELLNIAIARMAKTGILGVGSPDQILEAEKVIFKKLCPTPKTSQNWAELAQVQSANLKHGMAVNLDPGSLILDTFFKLEDCSRKVS